MPIRQFPAPRFVKTSTTRLAVYEEGNGPAVVLLHGWPELAYSWRHQISALAAAGYRVVAPDQRGYGLSDIPDAVEDYDILHLATDMRDLLDALGIEQAVFVGHDWGGIVAWNMPLIYPERVRGVVGINTPYFVAGVIGGEAPFRPRSDSDPVALMRAESGDEMYVAFFQTPGAAEALLEADLGRTFRTLMRRDTITMAEFTKLPREARIHDFVPNWFRVPEPAELPGQPLLSEEEMRVYLDRYARTGFRGPINYYRNMSRNWELSSGWDLTIDKPCLMISAEDDFVLPPAMTDGMEKFLPDLEKHVIPGCGHWTQQEKPGETNALLTNWLARRFPA